MPFLVRETTELNNGVIGFRDTRSVIVGLGKEDIVATCRDDPSLIVFQPRGIVVELQAPGDVIGLKHICYLTALGVIVAIVSLIGIHHLGANHPCLGEYLRSRELLDLLNGDACYIKRIPYHKAVKLTHGFAYRITIDAPSRTSYPTFTEAKSIDEVAELGLREREVFDAVLA